MAKPTKADLIAKLEEMEVAPERIEACATNADLEALIKAVEEEKAAPEVTAETSDNATSTETDGAETGTEGAESGTEGTENETPEGDTPGDSETNAPEASAETAPEGEFDESAYDVKETNVQMEISRDYIHNASIRGGSPMKVINHGMGDLYVSTKTLAKQGNPKQRLKFNEERLFEDAETVFMISSAMPNVTVIEYLPKEEDEE